MAAARKGFRQPPFPPADRAAMPGSGRFVRTRTACDIKERSVMGMHDVEAGERAAGMAALLAALLRDEPRGEWLGQLAADEVFAELPYAQEREDAEAGRALVEAWLATCDEAALEAARSDYMALFVGPGTPLAPPWESVCRHKDEALVFQKETLEVRAAYRELGLQVEKLHHEPDDHIAYELEFFAAAVWQAAEAAKAGGASRAAKAQAVLRDFLERHLAQWGFTWADLVLEHAKTDFYRGAALMVKGCLQEAREQSAA